MPTTDCHTQETAGLPRLCRVMPQLPSTTYAIPPVDRSTEASVRQIVDLIAEADAVLATGHLSTRRNRVAAAGRARGRGAAAADHPSGLHRPGDVRHRGGRADRPGRLRRDHRVSAPAPDAAARRPRLADFVRTVGTDRIVLSSDAGQPDSPPPPEALSELLESLVREGLDRGALTACASELPERLVTPRPG